MRDEPPEEGKVRRDPFDDRLVERSGQAVEGGITVGAVCDELRDQRVVPRADLVTLGDAGVDPDALGKLQTRDRARLREEAAGILGVEACLHGVPGRPGRESVERLAVRDAELELDEVEAGHRLGDGMLDLDPRVQLEEEDVLAVDEELRRARALVAELSAERHRVRREPLAESGGEGRRGGLLDDLLMPPLDRAVALAERDDGAAPVADNLDLHVARGGEIPLAEDRAVAEGGLGLARRRLEGVGQLVGARHDAHPAAAAAGRRLDEQREPELVGVAGGKDRHPGRGREALRLELVAAATQGVGWRADPREPRREHRVGEAVALREEAVARVDELGACAAGGRDQSLRVQVGRDVDRGVRDPRVQRLLVPGPDRRDRRDAESPTGREDPDGDLAAIGNEERSPAHRGRP
jgi:hypothetical protein